jgi:antitoxin MazE
MEANMQVNIRSLGNSKGILIPKPILEQTGLQDVAELRVNNGVIEIRPVKTNPREGWAMDSQRIAMDKDDSLEFGNADDKDLKW